MTPFLQRTIVLLLLPLGLAAAAPPAEIGLPAMPPAADFLKMAERSPFTGSPSTLADGAAGGGAWELWGIIGVNDKSYAIIRHTETKRLMYLTDQPNAQGMRLAAVQMGDDPRKDSVLVEWNGSQMRLGYAADLFKQQLAKFDALDKLHPAPKP